MENKKNKFLCNKCNRSFPTKRGLETHTRVHSIRNILKKEGVTVERILLLLIFILTFYLAISSIPLLLMAFLLIAALVVVFYSVKSWKDFLANNEKFFIAIFAIIGSFAALYFGIINLMYQEATFYPQTFDCPGLIISDSMDENGYYFTIADQNFVNYGVFPGGISACISLENAYTAEHKREWCSRHLMLKSDIRLSPRYRIYVDKNTDEFYLTESIMVSTKSNQNPLKNKKSIRVCNCKKIREGRFICLNED